MIVERLPPSTYTLNDAKKTLLTQADQCVKCGMCLPHCPTYRETRVEGHSPRGRISLMQALVSGHIEADASSLGFLDACLGCRYCETVCPSNVQYSTMLEQSRTLFSMPEKSASQKWSQCLMRLMVQPSTWRTLFYALWLAQRTGLLAIAKKLAGNGVWRRRLNTLPRLSLPRQQRRRRYPPPALPNNASHPKKTLSLFIGCTGDTLGQAALNASITCLNQLGYEVALNKHQGCCGFLQRHQGESETANALAENNLKAFSATSPESTPEKILVFATGCQLALKEYPKHLGEKAQKFSASVENIGTFLASQHKTELLTMAMQVAALPCHVFIHAPCTQNSLKEAGLTPLIEQLNNVKVSYSSSGQCCGAAGSYFLTQADMAATLASNIIDDYQRSGATVFLTSNVGCELHLRAALNAEKDTVKVMHPIQFLAERITKQ